MENLTPILSPKRRGRSACEDFGHAVGEVFEAFRAVGAGLFGDAPTVVADVVEGFHDGGPVIVAFEEVGAFAAGVFFDVKFLDALSKDVNPMIGPADSHDVADVEMPADGWAVEFVDVTRGFERAEEKMVADVFDGDFDAEF